MNPLLEVASHLLPTALNAIPQLVSPNTAAQPQAMDAPRDDRVHLMSAPLPPAPTIAPSTQQMQRTPGLTIPFQFLFYDLDGTESKTTSKTVADIDTVKAITQLYRDATLSSLEAVIYPSAAAIKDPVTVDLLWTSANVTFGEGDSVIKSPTSVRFTVGGLAITQQGVLPCDLSFVNPIIKSPVPYTNHPVLHASFHQSGPQETKNKTRATIFIRGNIKVSHPIIYKTS